MNETEYNWNQQKKDMKAKAEAMTQEERDAHMEKPRNLTVKVHPTPYYHRDPHTVSFGSFAAFYKWYCEKGWDAPGIVWVKEGEKYHEGAFNSDFTAVSQSCVHMNKNTRRSDDMALAWEIPDASNKKLEMA